jgi:PadR family transcriptional regulator, regulatory protein PadR
MAKAAHELPPGTLELLTLKVLLTGPMHGYAIMRMILARAGTELRIEEGTLYPALHRMERRGWIDSEWGLSETNRKAKFYRLTADGRRELRAQESAWRHISSAVGQVLGGKPREA